MVELRGLCNFNLLGLLITFITQSTALATMNIGVLKENKIDERRVALQPNQVKQLVQDGHQVLVEFSAGKSAQYSDRSYQQAGAIIAEKQQILQNSKLLLKVKCPIAEEYNDYNSEHILFTYLHFDENISLEKTKSLIKSGFLGIAYEWVKAGNTYPLLEPMSKLTGYLFYQRSVELLAQHKGVLAGAYNSEIPGGHILIIGLGRIGVEVLKCALLNRLNITIIARNTQQVQEKTRHIFEKMLGVQPNINLPTVIPFDDEDPEACKVELQAIMPKLDIVINCAVRRQNLTKTKLSYLLDRSMIAQMQPKSIICDATACDQDLIETCISSERLNHYDVIDDVIHYSPDHIPSYVPKTSTDLLSNATFPYVQLLAEEGINALKTNKALREGASCYRGQITHNYTATKKGFEYTDILALL
jgi:alanine dehydrogenase